MIKKKVIKEERIRCFCGKILVKFPDNTDFIGIKKEIRRLLKDKKIFLWKITTEKNGRFHEEEELLCKKCFNEVWDSLVPGVSHKEAFYKIRAKKLSENGKK